MQEKEQDAKMFQALHGGELGSLVQDYLERLISYMADIRTLAPGEQAESRQKVLAMIEKFLVKKIKAVNVEKNVPVNEFK